MNRAELTVKVIRKNLSGEVIDLEYLKNNNIVFYQTINTVLLNNGVVEITEPEDIDRASKVHYLELDNIRLAEDFYKENIR